MIVLHLKHSPSWLGLTEMPPWIRRVALLIAAASPFGVSVSSGQVPEQILRKTFPSIVLLVMRDANARPLSLGSGFFVRGGIVATDLHVIKGAASGYAKLVGQTTKYGIAGVLAVDEARDLVLLAVKETGAPSLVLGDSHRATVGQAVYVIGNPKGLEGTVSQGIISGVRQVGSETLLQITAPISPGSSGGPVLDVYGSVIGVAVATVKGGQNLNFAVPSSYLASLLGNMKPLKPLVAEERPRLPKPKRNAPPSAKSFPETEFSSKHPHVDACARGTKDGRSYAEAEQECRMALLDTEYAATAHFLFADLLLAERKWNGAIAEYNASLRLSRNDDFSIHQAIGKALEGKGDLDAAIAEYRLALRLAPSQISEQVSGAMPPFGDIIGDSLLAGVHFDLGGALFLKNDLDGAVAEFQEAVRLTPDNQFGYEILAEALLQKGDHAAALDQCRTARELTPSDEVVSRVCETLLYQLKK